MQRGPPAFATLAGFESLAKRPAGGEEIFAQQLLSAATHDSLGGADPQNGIQAGARVQHVKTAVEAEQTSTERLEHRAHGFENWGLENWGLENGGFSFHQ